MQRRTLLAAASTGLVALAGCGGGGSDDYGDWFEDVDNYDGDVDRTSREVATVQVGTEDGFAFTPAAIRVDAGTTVRWVWTGKGGRHNVVERDGEFESEYYETADATYEYTFDDPGVYPYYCEPHRALGMKGGVHVE